MTSRILLVMGLVAGGAGGHVRMLAEGLAGRGHRVTIACPSDVADAFDLASLDVAFERLEITSRPAPRADSNTMRRLRMLASVHDVVHAHGVRAGGMACLASAGTTPVVVTLHNAAPVHGIANRAIFQSLERIVARRASAVLAVSDDLTRRLRHHGAESVELAVVPAPGRSASHRGMDPDVTRRDLHVAGPLAVVVGRLTEQKGLPLMLEAADLLKDTPLTWLVAGEGPDRSGLQASIDAKRLPVRLLGHRDDVPDLLHAADVVVSTAVWEGQPVWLQEALGVGAAIVATDVGGTRDVVGQAAILVPRKAKRVADAIRGLLDDPTRLASLRAAATARATGLPTIEDALDQVERVYAAVQQRR